jgi:phosphatidylinositol-3-phosphatase
VRRSRFPLAIAAALAILGLSAYQNSASASPDRATATTAATATPAFGHVFVIVGENKSLAQMTSTPSKDPYITGTLKPRSAWFTGYNSVTTGSLADYIALTSGQYAECQRTGPCGRFDVPNLFNQLGNGNWKAWMESMPSNCYPHKSGSKDAKNFYKNGHNPVLMYTDLMASCPTYDVPAGTTGPNDMSRFNAALQSGSVPRYNFISPNGCEAGYQTCTDSSGAKVSPITGFDNFVKKEIPLIQASPAYGSNSLIVVTFDEGGATRGTGTMLAVVGPQVRTGTYGGYYDHYSTLLTIQRGLVPNAPCLAHACNASPLPIF